VHFIVRGVSVLHAADAAQCGRHPGWVVDGIRPDGTPHQEVLPTARARLADRWADAGSIPGLIILEKGRSRCQEALDKGEITCIMFPSQLPKIRRRQYTIQRTPVKIDATTSSSIMQVHSAVCTRTCTGSASGAPPYLSALS
jgi:hypothetical protein